MLFLWVVVPNATGPDLLEFALARWRTEPAMRIEDAYKWLYHATMGADHAVDDYEGARSWLLREWSGLGQRAGEPEVVPLTPDGRWIRINLRPFRDRGGDPEFLAALFFMSGQGPRASLSGFQREWHRLGEYLRRRPLPRIGRRDWSRLDREAASKGYPAIHHSSAYSKERAPAYRVIRGDLWLGERGEARGVEIPGVALSGGQPSAPCQGDHGRVVGAQVQRRRDES